MKYAVITENDESNWDDITGQQYHFPHKYVKILEPGTKVIYYKGKMTNRKYLEKRLSKDQHYFALAEIGKVNTTNNKDYYADIINYSPFNLPISFKLNDKYLEDVPENKKLNYFRDGVRPITKENFDKILFHVVGELKHLLLESIQKREDEYTTTFYEGAKRIVYTTKYEREPKARKEAIKIHGLSCMVCDINFEERYGDLGKGFIHVHHNKPLYMNEEKTPVNPEKDLDILCPNCHSMIHRKRDVVLKVEELRAIILLNKK